MGKTTDQLMDNVSNLTATPKDEELALLLTTGEQQTVSYLSMVLNDIGVNARAMTGYQAGIKNDWPSFKRAELLKSIQKHLIKHSPTKMY